MGAIRRRQLGWTTGALLFEGGAYRNILDASFWPAKRWETERWPSPTVADSDALETPSSPFAGYPPAKLSEVRRDTSTLTTRSASLFDG